jgi:polyisoprenoid-binding protein YceI
MRTLFGAALLAGMTLVAAACSDPTRDMEQAATGDAVEESTAAASAESVAVVLTPENTDIQFVGSKVTGSHIGGFRQHEGTVTVDGDRVLQVEVTIDLDTIWTDDKQRDNERLTGHLKSGDFFDAENHPHARFVSTGIAQRDDGRFDVTGNLTMRGVTRSVTFPAAMAYTDGRLTVDANFRINRHDWNVSFPGMEDDLIRDHVGLTLQVNAAG